jgi:hypothetical protein
MSAFAILNDTPSLRDKITAELVTDDDGHLKLRINGFLILYLTDDGLLSLMRDDVSSTATSSHRFQVADHILYPRKD